MMTKMQKTLYALAVLSVTAGGAKAQSVNLNITGKIVPAACTPVLSGNGVQDIGEISAKDLSYSAITSFVSKDVNLTITCDAPTSLALKSESMRKGTTGGSVAENAKGAAYGGLGNYYSFVGLGLAPDQKKIGGYAIFINNIKTDNISSVFIKRDGETGNWGTNYNSELYSPGDVYRYVSFADSGTTVPKKFKTLTASFKSYIRIVPASGLDLSQPIKLDGMTNIEMVYL